MSNKYLEKIAETYTVRPHTDDARLYNIKQVNLTREDMEKYKNAKGVNPYLGVAGIGAGAAAGGYVGNEYAKATMMNHIQRAHSAGLPKGSVVASGKLKAFHNRFLGALVGGAIAGNIVSARHHNKQLANAGLSVVHGKKND
jgi:hypothetical protein